MVAFVEVVTIGKYDYGGLFLRMPWRKGMEGSAVNSSRLKNQEAESIVENSSSEDEVSFTTEALQQNENSLTEQETENDLSEFGVESDAPDLFNNERESSNSNELLSSENNEDQEDDLEIPAFLRRQKN